MTALGDSIRTKASDLTAIAASVDALGNGGSASPPDTRPTKLVGFGNSVILGVRAGVVETDTFLYKISQARGFQAYQNMGVGGESIVQMFNRRALVISACAGFNAHVLVQAEGINSFDQGVSGATHLSKLTTIVQDLIAAGIRVTVCTDNLWRSTNAINGSNIYLENAKAVAALPGVSAFMDFYNHMVYIAWVNNPAGSSTPALATLYASNGTDTQHLSLIGNTEWTNEAMKFPKVCSLV